ncbi:MAG: leucyl aminopeptidase, partial [Candidatus Ruminococcus intestinipullorum]|nr:leucyl aminopeptidase [Candidatus Ruminococcus intestinipullorum]
MVSSAWQIERNNDCKERHELSIDRLKNVVTEETVEQRYQEYFQRGASFLLKLEEIRQFVEDGSWNNLEIQEMQALNEELYVD